MLGPTRPAPCSALFATTEANLTHWPFSLSFFPRNEVICLVGIPSEFIMMITGDGLHRPCRVAWRKAGRIRISFILA